MRRARAGCPPKVTCILILSTCYALTCLRPVTAAQQRGTSAQSSEANGPKGENGHAAHPPKGTEAFEVHGVVTTVRGARVSGADVEISLQGVEGKPLPPQTVATDLHGEFKVKVPAHSPHPWVATLNASKNGFLGARDSIEVTPEKAKSPVELVLQKTVEDPHLLPLVAFVDAVTPKFQPPSAGTRLPGIDARRYALAFRFLGRGDAASAEPVLSDVARRNSACFECQMLAGLTALQCGGWSTAASELARAAHLAASAQGDARSPDPFVALGVLQTWRGEFPKAAVSFLQALASRPDNPLALQELGRVFVLEGETATGDVYLQRAIAHGAGADAHVLRAQALLELEQTQKARAELDVFLGGRKPKDLPEGLRGLWAELVQRADIESRGGASTVVQRDPAQLAAQFPELKGMTLDADQSQLEPILRKISDGVQTLFESFPDTSSHEEIQMEVLHPNGKVAQSHAEQFQYLMVNSSDENGLRLSEYRTDKSGNRATPGGGTDGAHPMVTLGFASEPLVFHHDYLAGSSLRFLGRQRLDGHDTLVIAFAQRPATAKMLEEFRTSNGSVVVLVQGIAWVDAVSYQVLRMRTDLLKPAPEVRLEAQTTDVHFGEVRFPRNNQALWLPQDVAVTVQWNGRTFRNLHHYSDYQLFQVNTRQKIKAPKAQEAPE